MEEIDGCLVCISPILCTGVYKSTLLNYHSSFFDGVDHLWTARLPSAYQTRSGPKSESPMFLSRADSELPIAVSPGRGDVRLWSAIEFALDMPWFLGTIEFFEDGVQCYRSLLTTVVFHLQDGLPPLPSAKLVDVRLISPGWLNGTGAWQMAPLREVRSGVCRGKELMMYGLTDSSWLIEDAIPIEQIDQQDVIFIQGDQ